MLRHSTSTLSYSSAVKRDGVSEQSQTAAGIWGFPVSCVWSEHVGASDSKLNINRNNMTWTSRSCESDGLRDEPRRETPSPTLTWRRFHFTSCSEFYAQDRMTAAGVTSGVPKIRVILTFDWPQSIQTWHTDRLASPTDGRCSSSQEQRGGKCPRISDAWRDPNRASEACFRECWKQLLRCFESRLIWLINSDRFMLLSLKCSCWTEFLMHSFSLTSLSQHWADVASEGFNTPN